MRISSLFLVVMAAATVHGFAIPSDQPEGVYAVHKDDNGTYVHTKIDPTEPISKRWYWFGPERKDNRALVMLTCGRGRALNVTDTEDALADLAGQCGQNGSIVPAAHNFYAIRGQVVAFACNFNGGPRRCFKHKVAESVSMIKEHCGGYNSGWADWDGNVLSYGYDTTAIDFCGVGTGG